MDSPTTHTLKLLEARVIELKRQHEEDTEALNAMIDMKANYMKFKIDRLLTLLTEMQKKIIQSLFLPRKKDQQWFDFYTIRRFSL